MCRETAVNRHREGTDIEALTSMQPPTGKGAAVIRSPKTPRKAGDEDQRQHSTLREREGGAGDFYRPLAAVLSVKPSSGLSPRLLPYFPKPGVTTPPPPQSLARNPDRDAMCPPSPLSKAPSARSPSPASTSRPKLNSHTSSSPSSAARSVPVQSSLPKISPRNPTPSQPSRNSTNNVPVSPRSAPGANRLPVTAPRASARILSPTPSTRSTARNPSPTQASRTTARNPSPSSRSSARTASPAPACRAGASYRPAASACVLTSLSSESTDKPAGESRKAASPVGHRKDAAPHCAKGGQTATAPETIRKVSTLASSLSSLDMNRSLNRSSKKDGGGGAATPKTAANLVTFPSIRNLTSVDLQSQRKERIGGCGWKAGGPKGGRVACEGMLPNSTPMLTDTRKRCHWITSQSEPDLVSYHDEVWGVPVHDDKLLFELLVLEGAQSELSRPQLVSMREYFREVLGSFDPAIVAKFDEKKIAALKMDEVLRQPEPKIRGVIENAKQLLKIMEEFGSFDRYLWSFVGFRPIVNSPRIFTQIPVKSSKSEALSKDLMRRGFRYVGPTIVYSFMQAAGLVNDHLVSCYRHDECYAISQVEFMERGINGDKADQ